ncbi:MAG: DNA polymerase IV [Candidatus Sumerlaeota bacterium]
MPVRILHFDMDAFFASVEVLDDPSLAGKRVIVGGGGARSVVCAASYEARKFGVHSAQPMRQALARCPDAVRIQPRMQRYRDISRAIFEDLERLEAPIEKMSVDEGYIDLSNITRSDGEAYALGEEIQNQIATRHQLPCSIGIAPCKFIAKIASDLHKPRALVLVRPSEVQRFLDPLDVSRIPGVGKVGEKKLKKLGIRTIRQLRDVSHEALRGLFGKWGHRLYEYARGLDKREVVTRHERKSLGREQTFEDDVTDLKFIHDVIDRHAERVATSLARAANSVLTVCVKVRYDDFSLVTRQQTYQRPMSRNQEIAKAAKDLLGRTEAGDRPIRLVGVSVSGFVEGSAIQEELPLFDDSHASET